MDFERIINGVIEGESEDIQEAIEALLEQNVEPLDIINEGLMKGMNIVGEQFKDGELFLPEVLLSAEAMADGIALVMPYIKEGEMSVAGTVVIGTVAGDLHDIGKNLVAMMMESAGFKVIDIGIDATAEKFVEAAKEHNADIIGMSAMLTTTMEYMQTVIDACNEAGVDAKFMIGGAPVTAKFGESIKAHYTTDAVSAVEKVKELI